MQIAWAFLFDLRSDILYTDNANLGNLRSPLLKGELNVDATITLINFVDIWLTTFKKNTVKLASYNRLITSKRALEDYDISRTSMCLS